MEKQKKRRQRIVIKGKTEVVELKPAYNNTKKAKGGPIEEYRFGRNGYYAYRQYTLGAGHICPAHESV
jgi:hypothetical protein